MPKVIEVIIKKQYKDQIWYKIIKISDDKQQKITGEISRRIVEDASGKRSSNEANSV